MIRTPYLLFLGDAPDQLAAKTAYGIAQWRPEICVGQLRLPGCNASAGVPDVSLAEARAQGARTFVVGVANRGGTFSPAMRALLVEAVEAGFDIANGLHEQVASLPEVAAAAARTGGTIHDVRVPKGPFPIATGARRPGKRVLMVGTDCSIGKMFTALAVERALQEAGANATFRATGQTGILITGAGVPLDAVVADFMAGAIEQLCPANDPDHWDVVEGQASVLHPSYGGVTLALVHGSQPDVMIVCHEPGRPHVRGIPGRPVPPIGATIAAHEMAAEATRPGSRVVGVALNTSALSEAEARQALAEAERATGLPATDPIRFGAAALARAILEAAL